MTELNNQINKPKKHLLILGAGASMSLVPEDNVLKKTTDGNEEKIDRNIELRLPSGWDLVNYIKRYVDRVRLWVAIIDDYEDCAKELEKQILMDGNEKSEGLISYIVNELSFNKYLKSYCDEKNITYIENILGTHFYDHIRQKFSKNTIIEFINKFLKNYSQHYKMLFIASSLVKKYNPISIDYFANNLLFFANDEINLLISEGIFKKENAVETIQKYLKLIIYEVLSQKQKSTIEYACNNADNNYIRHIIWNMTLEANRIDKELDPKAYIEENLDIITFNYDITSEILLYRYNQINSESFPEIGQNTSLSNKVNVIHVYSHLYSKPGEGRRMLFNRNKEVYPTIDILDTLFTNTTRINELLRDCDYYINWIRANHDDSQYLTTKCVELINRSDNIYFLGFGFDKNNLKQIGLGNGVEKSRIELKERSIYVSKGNNKILALLNNLLLELKIMTGNDIMSKNDEIQSRFGSTTIFNFKSKEYSAYNDASLHSHYMYATNSGLQVSFNNLDDAFAKDFEI